MKTRVWLWIAISAIALSGGCASARRSEPLRGALVLNGDSERQGQVLFMRNCNRCHPGGAAGLGPAINNKPLPALAIRTQIRNGAGRMPRFDSSELTNEQVNEIISYLKALRGHK